MFSKGTRFPEKLCGMLSYAEHNGMDDVVSWTPDGLALTVHDPDRFSKTVLCLFFETTKYRSFIRQLNHWSFYRKCNTENNNNNSNNKNLSPATFAHPYFTRSNQSRCKNLTRECFKRTPEAPTKKRSTQQRDGKKSQGKTSMSSHLRRYQKEGANSKQSSSSSSISSTHDGQSSYPAKTMALDRSPISLVSLSDMDDSYRINMTTPASSLITEDNMNFLDGDSVDFEGKTFYFIDLNFSTLLDV
jgi:hypothetical protein